MRTSYITLALICIFAISGFESTNRTSDQMNRAFSAYGCDETEVERIDEIKFIIAHRLIDAKTVNAITDDSTELTAFYVGSDLVKLSVDAKGFMEEIYVSEGNPVCFEITSFASDSKLLENYYFKDNKLVCRENPMTGERSGPPEEPETDLIVGFEYYLNFIQ